METLWHRRIAFKPTWKKLGFCIVTALLIGWQFLARYEKMQAMAFVTHAAEQFRHCPDLKALNALPNSERPLFVREFPNGEWVAIKMEHECCSGAGFKALVFVDSKKQIFYNTTKNYCGYEGISANMPGPSTPGLDAFYSRLGGVERKVYNP